MPFRFGRLRAEKAKPSRSAPPATSVEGSGIAVIVKVVPLKEELPKPPLPLKVKPVMDRLLVVWKTRVLPCVKFAMLSTRRALGV